MFMWLAIGLLLGLILGAAGVLIGLKVTAANALKAARAEVERMITDATTEARNKAKEIELTARQEQLKRKEETDRNLEAARNDVKNHEARLVKREEVVDRKLDTLSVKEKHLSDLETRLGQRDRALTIKEQELTEVLAQQRQQLLQLTGMSTESAKELLLKPAGG
jgi:ribonucrease Y